ncbi:hypothetical protein F6455_14010 [Proteobacteria bacterium 005FR1]|nr:hypothetical protein [Proteobacteria bacterium 005FR1]
MKRRSCIAAASLSAVLLASSGCGYFLYPERVGQTSGRIDPAVALLDAAGLLIGIIPGVIAFAVDISTGTIYLPQGEENVIEKHQKRLSSFDSLELQPVDGMAVNVDQTLLAEKLTGELGDSIDPAQISYYRVRDGELVWLREVR